MRMIISIVVAFMFVGFVTPASAFVFGFQVDQNGNFAFAIGVPANQGNQYYESRPHHQWPRTMESRRQPQYNTPPAIPYDYELKDEVEQSGRLCGRIARIQDEWYCRPQ